jgi:hypothetical protein
MTKARGTIGLFQYHGRRSQDAWILDIVRLTIAREELGYLMPYNFVAIYITM